MKQFLLITYLIFLSACVFSQHAGGSLDSKGVSYQILPVAWYVPETGFTIGLTGISTFRLSGESNNSRASSILFDAAVTLKGKVFAFIPFEIYKGEDKYRLKGELGMYKYFYSFYGIGSETKLEDKETYNVVFPRLLLNLTRQVKGPFFAGGGYRFDYFNITSLASEGILENVQPSGYKGGTVSSGFITFLMDSRDHIFDTKKGFYLETILEKSLSFLGATYNYDKIEIDARSFHSLGHGFILANNAYYSQMYGDAPFFTMPYLSSSRRGRGYADRRFMDKTLFNFQSEIRFPLFWRLEGAVMASAGTLGPDAGSLNFNDLKWAYGAGIRFIVDKVERNKIRLDLGFTPEDFNFYITANEAF
jgi:hypothetical protein